MLTLPELEFLYNNLLCKLGFFNKNFWFPFIRLWKVPFDLLEYFIFYFEKRKCAENLLQSWQIIQHYFLSIRNHIFQKIKFIFDLFRPNISFNYLNKILYRESDKLLPIELKF